MTGAPVTVPSTERHWEQRVELATAFRAAARHGFHEGIDNHFSAVVAGADDLFLLNRFGPHWSEMSPNDVLTINLDGQLVSDSGQWEHTAFVIHRAVHRVRADAGACCTRTSRTRRPSP
jgi:ribulose-5-phosphate 4-epimerase/fuculose-1-phosphate aldolase